MIDVSQIVLAAIFSVFSWGLAFLAYRKFARFSEMPSAFGFDGKTVLCTTSRSKAIFGHPLASMLIFTTLIVLQARGVQFLSSSMGMAGLIMAVGQISAYAAMDRWAEQQA